MSNTTRSNNITTGTTKDDDDDNNNLRMKQRYKIILYLFVIATCSKLLLLPVYKSTDYNVHRHWKAVTRNIRPIYRWYYDDQYIPTIHTVDYPPGFILFLEAILSNWYYPYIYNNRIVQLMIDYFGINDMYQAPIDNVTSTCLALLSDTDLQTLPANINPLHNYWCLLYMRSTVIVSDIVLWIGAYIVATTIAIPSRCCSSTTTQFSYPLFVLLTFHPGLLLLDHIHFQYNGFLLGILLISIGLLLHANNNNETTTSTTKQQQTLYHLTSASLFALLVTYKHLYITLSLWYVAYLFRRYCYNNETRTHDTTTTQRNNTGFNFNKFIQLGIITVSMVVVPFIPFIVSIILDSPNQTETTFTLIQQWLLQVTNRLFPFQRGLVHDYWAGNIWSFYVAIRQYVVPIVQRKLPSVMKELTFLFNNINNDASTDDPITPFHCLVLLVVGLLPSTVCAWIAAAKRNNSLLLLSFTHAAFTTFLFAYHGHEKAIMTTCIPLTIWTVYITTTTTTTTAPTATTVISYTEKPTNDERNTKETKKNELTIAVLFHYDSVWTIYWELSAVAIVSFFPLLYQKQEVTIKSIVLLFYLAALSWYIQSNRPRIGTVSRWLTFRRYCVASVLAIVVIQLDYIPIQYIYGRYEFLPLAITSLVCATGYLFLYLQISYYMYQNATIL